MGEGVGGVGPAVSEQVHTDCREHTHQIQALTAQLDALTARLTRLEQSAPVEPEYSIPQAALLLHIAPSTLSVMLAKHRARLSPKCYRRDQRKVAHRMIPAADLRCLRSMLRQPSTRYPRHTERQAA